MAKTSGAGDLLPTRLICRSVFALLIAGTSGFAKAEGPGGTVTIKLSDTRFDCKEPILAQEPGFERCELYTVPRFTAPKSALLRVFGHCEATIRYRTRDGLMDDQESFYERFDGAIVDGSGLSPVTMTLKPLKILFDPIVEAKVTRLECAIDEVFD
jgi:hypothetical protein